MIVDIDGRHGEGGGQILRTSLALAMITGKTLRMDGIRAGRAKPGLRRQHLACVEAAAQLCNAEVRGAELGSQRLDFTPHSISGGELRIDIGSAGSTMLVVQTILVAAIAAKQPLRAVIVGGTHNPLAPPFDFLSRVYLPLLHAMGADVELTLDRHGFAAHDDAAPRKATRASSEERQRDVNDQAQASTRLGQVALSVGAGALRPIERVASGEVTARHAAAILSRLPTHVGERELGVVRDRLGFAPSECEIRDVRASSTANVLLIEVERGGCRELVSSFGAQGLRAEAVAHRACDAMAAYLAADVPVGEHLADQLVLPLAVAGGGRFRCAPLSLHATTNIDTIGRFLDVPISVAPDGDAVIVAVG